MQLRPGKSLQERDQIRWSCKDHAHRQLREDVSKRPVHVTLLPKTYRRPKDGYDVGLAEEVARVETVEDGIHHRAWGVKRGTNKLDSHGVVKSEEEGGKRRGGKKGDGGGGEGKEDLEGTQKTRKQSGEFIPSGPSA